MFDIADEQIDLIYQRGRENDNLPLPLRRMVMIMYYRRTRKSGGFFCAYSAAQIRTKAEKDNDSRVCTIDHIVPKSFGQQLNENIHDLQALAWDVNDRKRKSINLHARVKAAQLNLKGAGIQDFRNDFAETLFVFDQRVKSGNALSALIVDWPWIWQEQNYPHRPFIPGYDAERMAFSSLEESLVIDESIRAKNMLAWKEDCKDIKKVSMVWNEYSRRMNKSPEDAARLLK